MIWRDLGSGAETHANQSDVGEEVIGIWAKYRVNKYPEVTTQSGAIPM